jgi:hypothetical protein
MEETIKMKYVAPEIVDFRWMEGLGNCASGSLAADYGVPCSNGASAIGDSCSHGGIAEYNCKSDGNSPSIGRCYNGPAESV